MASVMVAPLMRSEVLPGRVSIMRDNHVSQLQSSILLATLSLIPNDALRYTLLLVTACLTLLYVIQFKRPSSQLRQLENTVKQTEEIIGDAKLYCPRDLLSLAEEGVRLLKVKRSASMIQCRMLEVDTLTWKKYRVLSRDIADCSNSIKKIQIAVQLILEAERQHKFTQGINETEPILAGARSPAGTSGFQTNASYLQQSYSVLHPVYAPYFSFVIPLECPGHFASMFHYILNATGESPAHYILNATSEGPPQVSVKSTMTLAATQKKLVKDLEPIRPLPSTSGACTQSCVYERRHSSSYSNPGGADST
ncbi:hypothetical protein C8R44DRAFT_730723 [Mycena epipterygia]|nr:hypothetical protein C8R44DRAFT_730723 [Mycena epipterygia]